MSDQMSVMSCKMRIDQVTEDRGAGGAVVQLHVHLSKMSGTIPNGLASAALTLQITDPKSFEEVTQGSDFHLELWAAPKG